MLINTSYRLTFEMALCTQASFILGRKGYVRINCGPPSCAASKYQRARKLLAAAIDRRTIT